MIILITMAISASGCGRELSGITWKFSNPLPVPGTCVMSAPLPDGFAVIGGTGWIESTSLPVKKWFKTAYRFRASENRWEALPEYPHAAEYGRAVRYKDKIIVIAGRDSEKIFNDAYLLDTGSADPRWMAISPLPMPRHQHGAGMIGNNLYVFMGMTGTVKNEIHEKSIIRLDLSNQAEGWKFAAEFPYPGREWIIGAVCGKKIYIFGGLAAGTAPDINLKDKERFRTVTNSFSGKTAVADAYSFDTETGEWKKIKPLPAPKFSGAAAVIKNRYIAITGGIDAVTENPFGSQAMYWSSECLVYDTATDDYFRVDSLKAAVCDHGCAAVDNKIFIIGGEDSPWKSRTPLVQAGAIFN